MEEKSYEELDVRHKQITSQIEKAAAEDLTKREIEIKQKYEKQKMEILEKYEKEMAECEQGYKTNLSDLSEKKAYYDKLYEEEDELFKELTKRRRIIQEKAEEMGERRRRISRTGEGTERDGSSQQEEVRLETGCDNLVRKELGIVLF